MLSVDADDSLHSRVHARIGLLGNPSDGFQGRCLSLSLANFYTEVTLKPSATIKFVPTPEEDPQEFSGLGDLVQHIRGAGHYSTDGGTRILQAMCKRFWEYCSEHSIQLPAAPNFSMSFKTTIPRQCGLSGSSAIACAALNCLLSHYDVERAVPVADRPRLVLSAELELGIAAGLQDRVIQVYGGLVFMVFDAVQQQQEGGQGQQQAGQQEVGGQYESLDPRLLPALHLIYRKEAAPGKDSGAVHSTVKQRWLAGDEAVRQGMQEIAALATQGRQALEERDYPQLAVLMNKNFQLRRQLYGDAVLGPTNLEMVETAASVGAAAKLTGSGGAVVALCLDGRRQVEKLQHACRHRGFECVQVEVGSALHMAPGIQRP